MPLTLHPVVGTIQITPHFLPRDLDPCDDSTLDLLLASFADRPWLGGADQAAGEPIRLVASRRLSWLPAADGAVVVRANLVQLMEQLQNDLQQLRHAVS